MRNWGAVVAGHGKGESSVALGDQAPPNSRRLVRGSSRRLMTMRHPPGRSANNRVIHRRSCPRPPPRGPQYLTGSFHNRAFLRHDRVRTRQALRKYPEPHVGPALALSRSAVTLETESISREREPVDRGTTRGADRAPSGSRSLEWKSECCAPVRTSSR